MFSVVNKGSSLPELFMGFDYEAIGRCVSVEDCTYASLGGKKTIVARFQSMACSCHSMCVRGSAYEFIAHSFLNILSF
jgi:hypothetical protein